MSRNSYAADVVSQKILPTWWMYVWIIFILHRCILQNALYELSRIKFFIKCSTDSSQFTSVIAGVHSYIDDDVLLMISNAMNKHHYYAKCISLLKHRQKNNKNVRLFILDFVLLCEIALRVIVITDAVVKQHMLTRVHTGDVLNLWAWEWYWELLLFLQWYMTAI